MAIDVRKSIINNFKDANKEEIKNSITASIDENEEITLPGLGVFFEVLWKNSDENSQEYILNTLQSGIKNSNN
ncbi:MAG: small acid-soluble spore protein SspI [Mollicutes bacterium]|jgi:small acid-soluble spore protein I (minor)|nr:small acid-soluble spore protein SspI [Mollicutes bacterium]